MDDNLVIQRRRDEALAELEGRYTYLKRAGDIYYRATGEYAPFRIVHRLSVYKRQVSIHLKSHDPGFVSRRYLALMHQLLEASIHAHTKRLLRALRNYEDDVPKLNVSMTFRRSKNYPNGQTVGKLIISTAKLCQDSRQELQRAPNDNDDIWEEQYISLAEAARQCEDMTRSVIAATLECLEHIEKIRSRRLIWITASAAVVSPLIGLTPFFYERYKNSK